MEHLQTIQQIFAARFLRVPDYQRGFAWEQEHWTDLLEDLELLESGADHYTGTLVLHAPASNARIMDEEGREHGVYDIVDGQQRLTTIVLLLDALRRKLPAGSPLADGIRKTYVMTKDLEAQLRPKLTLNRDTHPYFETQIIADHPGIEGPQIRSQRLLRDAQAFFREYLETQLRRRTGDGAAWLLELHKKVTNGLKLTVYEVPRASDVGVIFEVMNNRGKPLSEMEKVKNYLLYVASKIPLTAAGDLAERINDTWRSIFEGLMEAGASASTYEDQLLRAHWLMAYDHKPKNWQGNTSIKLRFSMKRYAGEPGRLLADLDKYVRTLREFAVAYCDIIAPTRTLAFAEYAADPIARRHVQQAAEKLVRVQSLAAFLPLLAAVRLTRPGDATLYLRFLELCEKYSFRVYRWAQRRANAGQTSLFKVGRQLYHGEVSPESALTSISGYLLHYAPESDFVRELETSDDWYNWHGLKYFLYEYEEHLAAGKGVQLPWQQLLHSEKQDTIEHILPQTPSHQYWKDRWTDDAVRRCVHDIGNLCLTFDNSAYYNKAFPAKRGEPGVPASYANSNLFMERQLATYDQWTEHEWLLRRTAITAWARERWGVAPPTQAPSADDLVEDDDEEA